MTLSRDRLRGTQGRWWLVESCLDAEPNPAAQALAICTTLMDRYGVLCREAFAAEGLKGGFSRYYPVLKALEERGQLRRGFYVDTLGATQFSIPGVADQLRTPDQPTAEPIWLSALDPAQPYGGGLTLARRLPHQTHPARGNPRVFSQWKRTCRLVALPLQTTRAHP